MVSQLQAGLAGDARGLAWLKHFVAASDGGGLLGPRDLAAQQQGPRGRPQVDRELAESRGREGPPPALPAHHITAPDRHDVSEVEVEEGGGGALPPVKPGHLPAAEVEEPGLGRLAPAISPQAW